MSELVELSVAELRAGLDAKKFSSVEVTTAFLDRAEKNADLGAFLTLCKDEAMVQAKSADERIAKGDSTSLLGIPVALKDNLCTKGVRTTCASKILDSFVPPYDATVISKLREEGAVFVGKTNLDEFAMGGSNENSAYMPVKNAWNKKTVSGGSSGGSAVSVSARLAPVSLGSDTGGSIRQPAALCSVVGIKPTYGRVSRYGLVAFASSLDQIGTFGNTVQDAATTLSVIAGHCNKDSTSAIHTVPDWNGEMKKDLKGLRVGVPKEYFVKGMDPEVEASVHAGIKTLESLGATTVEISLPHTEYALSCYYIIAPAEASSNLARFDGIRYGHRAKDTVDLLDLFKKSRSEGFGREVQRRIMIGTYVLSSGYYDAYYLQAQKVRTLIAKDFSDAFNGVCDIIACPTSPVPAFEFGAKSDPLSMYLCDIFTIPLNMAGLPGMSVPCGFTKAGLPIGMQLIGKAWDEGMVFRVGNAFEKATDWHTRRPQL